MDTPEPDAEPDWPEGTEVRQMTVREALRFQSGYFGLHKNDDSIDELDHARFWTNIATWASAGHAAAPSAIAMTCPDDPASSRAAAPDTIGSTATADQPVVVAGVSKPLNRKLPRL